MFFVGTSGWHYRDWSGRFYPADLPTSGWLQYYSGRFGTVELNNSFYRLPDRSTFNSWRRQLPENFVMTVKASRYITHLRRLREPEEPVARLWSAARGLGPALGPILFQLPPDLEIQPDRLHDLLNALPDSMRSAFEFRHRSWFVPEIFNMLDSAGAALVWADSPGIRLQLPLTAGWGYVRFHRGRRAGAGYRRSKLVRWADRLVAARATNVFAYFNNDHGAAAVHDADVFSDLLMRRGVPMLDLRGHLANDAQPSSSLGSASRPG